jgi:hypothetical protein
VIARRNRVWESWYLEARRDLTRITNLACLESKQEQEHWRDMVVLS